MKKKKDLGLQYMLELNIKPAKSSHQLYLMLVDRLGQKVADDFADYFEARAAACDRGDGAHHHQDDRFYRFKNRDLETALAVSGGFDGDILRQTCNYIASVADEYKGCARILEVGCDCGILSCFLGRMFPDATIIAIDRCKEAISVARELAKKLDVSNVQFLHADIYELPEEQYDAIVSIRVMHENIRLNCTEDHTLLMDTQGDMFADATKMYAGAIASRLAAGGALLSIERCGRNPLLYGWMLALNECGISVRSCEEMTCQETGDVNRFQALCMKKEGEPLSRDEIRNAFSETYIGKINLNTADFSGWDASIVLQLIHGELIGGVFAYVGDKKVAKFALWESAECETDVLYEQHNVKDGIINLYIRDKAMIEEINAHVAADKEFAINEWGATLKPFKLMDGKEILS